MWQRRGSDEKGMINNWNRRIQKTLEKLQKRRTFINHIQKTVNPNI